MSYSEAFNLGPAVIVYSSGAFTARTSQRYPNNPAKYSLSLVMDDNTKNILEQQLNAFAQTVYGTGWQGHQTLSNPIFKPINAQTNAKLAEQMNLLPAGYTWIVKVSKPGFSKTGAQLDAPIVVDANNQALMNAIDPATGKKPLYDGAFVEANVNFYSHDSGISLGFNGVRKIGDGNELTVAGAPSVTSMFGSAPATVPVGTPAPNMGQPQGMPQNNLAMGQPQPNFNQPAATGQVPGQQPMGQPVATPGQQPGQPQTFMAPNGAAVPPIGGTGQ